MSLRDLFLEIFGPFERAIERAGAEVEHEATPIIHATEKEIEMALPQNVSDSLDHIKAALAGAVDQKASDATTIANLNKQVSDLTAERDALQSDLTALQNAVAALDPAVVAQPTAQAQPAASQPSA